jgi:hypothetical protein
VSIPPDLVQSNGRKNSEIEEVAKRLPLEQKLLPLAHGAGIEGVRFAAREDEMNAAAEEKVGPVEPERLHQALGIYQSALAAKAPEAGAIGSESADEPASLRGMLAVKREFPDPKEFLSLSLRLKRFTEVVSDKKLIKWGMVKHSEGGLEIHDAVVNALAAAPFRKSGVLDKDAFHELVKAEYTRLEAEEKA